MPRGPSQPECWRCEVDVFSWLGHSADLECIVRAGRVYVGQSRPVLFLRLVVMYKLPHGLHICILPMQALKLLFQLCVDVASLGEGFAVSAFQISTCARQNYHCQKRDLCKMVLGSFLRQVPVLVLSTSTNSSNHWGTCHFFVLMLASTLGTFTR